MGRALPDPHIGHTLACTLRPIPSLAHTVARHLASVSELTCLVFLRSARYLVPLGQILPTGGEKSAFFASSPHRSGDSVRCLVFT